MHIAKHVGAKHVGASHVGASHEYWDTKSCPMRPTCQSMIRPMSGSIPAGQDRGSPPNKALLKRTGRVTLKVCVPPRKEPLDREGPLASTRRNPAPRRAKLGLKSGSEFESKPSRLATPIRCNINVRYPHQGKATLFSMSRLGAGE